MKVILNTDNIDLSHIKEVLEFTKELNHKKDNLSVMEIHKNDKKIKEYYVNHVASGYKITSRNFEA